MDIDYLFQLIGEQYVAQRLMAERIAELEAAAEATPATPDPQEPQAAS